MDNMIKLFHVGTWYRAYGNDAKVISSLMNYRVFYDHNYSQISVGFPEQSITKVKRILDLNKMRYSLIENSNNINDLENIDDRVYDLYGSFAVKYEGDHPIESFIIGDTISKDAELTKKVILANVGDIIKVNDNRVLLIEKNIKKHLI